jgi:hypothetical protein
MLESQEFTDLRISASRAVDNGLSLLLNRVDEVCDNVSPYSLTRSIDNIESVCNKSLNGLDKVFNQYVNQSYIHGYKKGYREITTISNQASVYVENGIFDITKRATDKALSYAKESAKKLGEVAKKKINTATNAIRSALIKGVTKLLSRHKDNKPTEEDVQAVKQLAKNIVREQINKLDKETKRLLQDELTASASEGKLGAYEDAGVNAVKVRIDTVNDEKRCGRCARLEGRIVPLEQAKSLLPVHPNCVKPQTTMVYTKRGWKYMEDLTTKDYCFSENPETGLCEFVKVKATITNDYDGDYVTLKNKTFYQEFTANHNRYVVFDDGKYELIPHNEINKPYIIPLTARNVKSEHYETKQIGGVTVPYVAYVYLIGYFLSYGHCERVDNGFGGVTYEVTLYSKTTERCIKIMNDIMPFHKHVNLRYDKYGVSFNHDGVGEYLFELQKTRHIPKDILKSDCGKIFLSAFSEKYFDYVWCVTDSKLRDDLTYLVLKTGGGGLRIQTKQVSEDFYAHTLCKTDIKQISGSDLEEIVEHYTGKVYCVELERNNTLFVNQGGFCSWIGNCRCMWRLVSDNVSRKIKKEQKEQEKKVLKLRERLEKKQAKIKNDKSVAVHNDSHDYIEQLEEEPINSHNISLDLDSADSPFVLLIKNTRIKKGSTGIKVVCNEESITDGKLMSGSILKLLGKKDNTLYYSYIGNTVKDRKNWDKEMGDYKFHSISYVPDSLFDYPYELMGDDNIKLMMVNNKNGYIVVNNHRSDLMNSDDIMLLAVKLQLQ